MQKAQLNKHLSSANQRQDFKSQQKDDMSLRKKYSLSGYYIFKDLILIQRWLWKIKTIQDADYKELLPSMSHLILTKAPWGAEKGEVTLDGWSA